MNIGPLVFDALTNLGVPVARGRLKVSGRNYPDVYLVFQVISAPAEAHADDREKERGYLVQVNYFCRGEFSLAADIENAMIGAGFRYMAGRELGEQETGHVGYSSDFYYLETKE